MPGSPRKPGSRADIIEAIRTAPDAALHARRRAHRLRLRHRVPRHQPRLGAQLQARRRCLRRAGRGRSGGRVRLLHAGVDDAQRLRDAAAAGRARAARLAARSPPMTFLLFLAAACVIALSPGPGIFYVAARTLADGRGEGLASSLGTGTRRPGPCRGGRGRRIGADHGERRGLRRAQDRWARSIWCGSASRPRAKQASMSPRRRAAAAPARPFATASWSRR